MAVVDGVYVDWSKSPRIVWIPDPLTEITLQDLHDTLRDIEDEPGVLQYPILISSAGKEALGGGVTVGITSTLQNAVVAFESRKVGFVGTVTTPDLTGRRLIDSGATFISDGVEPGSFIVNTTDASVCTVLTVVSETELVTDILGGGGDNEWAMGDSYELWNVVQVEVTGGNLVAVDDVGNPIDAVLPTFANQVIRTSASSATVQELIDIQYAAFGGAVSIDTVNGVPGTDYPIGNQANPVDNLTDALTIAAERGFEDFRVLGNITVAGVDVSNHRFIGQSPAKSVITIDASATVAGCSFVNSHVTGALDGTTFFLECVVSNVTQFNGTMERCALFGTITPGGGAQGLFLECWQESNEAARPTIDMGATGGGGEDIAFREYSGGLVILNLQGTDEFVVDFVSGDLFLGAGIVGGSVLARGAGQILELSTGDEIRSGTYSGATITNETVSSERIKVIQRLLQNRFETDPNTGVATLYDDDGVTPLYTANIYEDVAAAQPYRGQGIERREALS